MFMSKMSPFQFRKLPFMQNLLTLCFPILKNGLFKHVASAGAIKENQSTGISVIWVVFCIFISKQVDELGVLLRHFAQGGVLQWIPSCCLRANADQNVSRFSVFVGFFALTGGGGEGRRDGVCTQCLGMLGTKGQQPPSFFCISYERG